MSLTVFDGIRKNLASVRDWGVALTVLVPFSLVIGRAAADILVSVVAVLFLADCIRKRSWTWVRQPWIVAAFVLWAYTVVRALFIPAGHDGLMAALVWVRYIVFAGSLAPWALAEEKGRTGICASIAGAVLFLSLDGFIQFVSGKDVIGHGFFEGTRLTGPYNRPILGITLANLFAPVIFWLLQRKEVLKSIALANICFITVFLSGDRMGLVLASLIMATWFFFVMREGSRRWLALGTMVCVFAALVFVAPLVTSHRAESLAERQIVSTLKIAGKVGESAYGRVMKSALEVGRAHPVFGVGMRQFRTFCLDESFGGPAKNFELGIDRCYTHPHNIYMEWLSEGGLVGLALFAGFVGTVFWAGVRRLRANRTDLVLWGLAALLGVRLMPLYISTSFFNNWSAIPFWLALGWAMSFPVAEKAEEKRPG